MNLNKRKQRADQEFQDWQIEKEILEQKQTIEEEKYELNQKPWKNKLAFGKSLMIFLFINFTILEIFTGWVTVNSFTLAYSTGIMPDFTPLITLLGAVIGETISYGVYCAKAKAENTEGGIVYETTMHDIKG